MTWTAAERQRLLAARAAGASISELAATHWRTVGAVKHALHRFGAARRIPRGRARASAEDAALVAAARARFGSLYAAERATGVPRARLSVAQTAGEGRALCPRYRRLLREQLSDLGGRPSEPRTDRDQEEDHDDAT